MYLSYAASAQPLIMFTVELHVFLNSTIISSHCAKVPLLPTSHVPSSNNRIGLSHWKGRPVIALEDWIQIRGHLPYRLEYFPDDFDQTLTYMELSYYRYEFAFVFANREGLRREGDQMDGGGA
jgi:hypothetical protein